MALSRRSRSWRSRIHIRSKRAALRHRFLCSPEPLEDRRLLSLASVDYGQPDPAWFAAVELPYGPRTLEQASVAAATADGTYAERLANPLYQPWIVRLTDEALAGLESITDVAQRLNAGDVRFAVVRGLGMPGQVLVSAIDSTPQEAAAALRANPFVSAYEPDTVMSGQATPNDPLFASQIGLHNTGQEGGTADADIDAPEAWNITTGSRNVVVAVIDTGVDYAHPDLAANIWTNPGEIAGNGVDDDHNGFVDDVHGYDFFNLDSNPQDDNRHGTHVAGTIGAVGNNALGVAGVAWATSIMPVKFLDANNQGPTSGAIEAINYVTMMRRQFGAGVRVINASWGGSGYSGELRAQIAAAGQADILFVAAAGNGDVLGRGIDIDATPFYPASYDLDNMITVAASDQNDKLARFSNYGSVSADLAAPGVGIVSTEPGSSYASRNGTSMAAPHVSGAAALVWSKVSYATAAEVRQALLQSVDVKAGLQGELSSGGRLNAYGALTTDTVPPRAALSSAPDITAPGDAYQTITVTYTDDTSVNVSTLDGGDLLLTRPDRPGETYTATFVSVAPSGNGPTRTATYRMAAPGGTWGTLDNGEYRIELVARQVADLRANYARAAVLGTFHCAVTSDGVFEVNTTLDLWDENPGDGYVNDGAGNASLRGAILESSLMPGGATIIVPAGIYTLSIAGADEDDGFFGDLDAYGQITIIGAGVDQTVIDGLWLDRVLDVHVDAYMTLSHLTITGGNVSTADGGGVRNRGTLTLDNVNVTGNTAGGEFRAAGPESRVNTVTTDTQQFADVATDAAGNYVVVWETRGATQSTYWFQRYTADGIAQGVATQVGSPVTLPAGSTWRPITVSMEATGKFAIAWTGAGATGNGLDIFFQRYFASGMPDGSQIGVLNTPTARTGDQVAPSVAIDSANDLIVAWQDLSGKDTSGTGIYAQRFRGASRIGGISLINAFVTGNQRNPTAEMDAAGNFVIAWESQNQDGDGYGIYGRRGNVPNATLGTEFRIHTELAGDQTLPAIAMDDAGPFIVAWQGPDDDLTGVFARRFDSSGTAQGNEFLINTTTIGAQTSPAVAHAANGSFAIAWASDDQDGSGSGLVGQRFSALGTRRGEEFPANQLSSGDQLHPRVAVASDNGFMITWDGAGPGDDTGVFARRFQSDFRSQAGGGIENASTLTLTETTVSANQTGGDGGGIHNAGSATITASTLSDNLADGHGSPALNRLGSQFTVNSAPAGGQQFPRVGMNGAGRSVAVWASSHLGEPGIVGTIYAADGSLVTDFVAAVGSGAVAPSVALDANGNSIVAWQDNRSGTSDIFARRYTANGTLLTSDFRVNLWADGQQANAQVAAAPDGQFAVAFVDDSSDGSGSGIYLRRFDSSGLALSSECPNDDFTAGSQAFAAIAMDATGAIVVAWSGNGPGDTSGIFARRYDSFGVPIGGQFRVNTTVTGVQHRPAVAFDETGFVICWESDGVDIFARRFGADGNPLGPDFEVDGGIPSSAVADVALLDRGAFVITWRSWTSGGTQGAYYARLFDEAGVALGSSVVVNTNSAGDPVSYYTSDVASNGTDQATIVWSSDAADVLGQCYSLTYEATGSGGGIANAGTLDLTNATLSGNAAAVQGGGLFNAAGASTTTVNNTVTDNSAAGDDGYIRLEPTGGEFRVNASTSSSQQIAASAMDAAGNYVVVWESSHEGQTSIFGQRFFADGQTNGGQFRISDTSVDQRLRPSVAMNAVGDFVVAWQGWGADAQDWGINANYFNADGSVRVGRFVVSQNQSGNQSNPIAAMDYAGNFVVAWVDEGAGNQIRARRFDRNCNALTNDFLVNTTTAGSHSDPDVAVGHDGSFLITWNSSQDGDGYEIYGQRYDVKGSTVGIEFRINTVTTGWQVTSSAAIAPNGAFVVAWQDQSLDGDGYGICAQRFEADGTRRGAPFRVNTYTPGDQSNPIMGFDSKSNLYVFWTSSGQDGSGGGIFGQQYNELGVPQGGEFCVNSTTAGDQWLYWNGRLAMNAGGNVVVVWSGNGATDDAGVYGQRYVPVVHDGGGIYSSYGGTVAVHNTLIAENTAVHASPDVAGVFNSQGNNLVGDLGSATGWHDELQADPQESRVNSYTNSSQRWSDIAVSEAGAAVVVWHGDQSGPWALYGQRYDAFGQRVGEEFVVQEGPIDGSALDLVGISVAMDRVGRFVVTWYGAGLDSDGYGVHARLFDSDGQPAGPSFLVNEIEAAAQTRPAVAMQVDGDFVIVWQSLGHTSDGIAIAGQRFTADGRRIGHEFLVTASLTVGPNFPDVAMDADGAFTVTWYVPDGDGDGGGIYARRFDAAAEPQGAAFRVNSTTTDEQRYPRIAMDLGGEVVIGWSSYGQDGSDYGAYAQRYSADGTAQGAEFRVNTATEGRQYLQGVAVDLRGDFVITWTSGPADGSDYDVYAQRYDRLGQPIGSEFRVNSTTAGNQDSAHVGMSAAGDFLVVWNGNGVGDSLGIFARRYWCLDRVWDTAADYLGPLADNGGPTLTHALLPGSPAIDGGSNTGASSTDQRGLARPQDANGDGLAIVDIGAYEVYYASLQGTWYRDTNGNGVRDAGEAGVTGETVFLDKNGNSLLDAGELSAATRTDDPATSGVDEAGTYSFPQLAPATHTVVCALPVGWEAVAPASGTQTVSLYAGQVAAGIDFATRPRPAQLHGQVFNDANHNHVKDPEEVGLAGWTVYLDKDGDRMLDDGETSVTSDGDGHYVFTDVPPLTQYTIAEVTPHDWEQTYPTAADNYVWTLQPAAGEVITDCDFGNYDLTTGGQGTDGALTGRVFRDDDEDRVQDPTEPGLIGYTLYLDLNDNGARDDGEPTAITRADDWNTSGIDETGSYQFTGLAGSTYVVRLLATSGAQQTAPVGNQLQPSAFATGEGPQSVALGDFDLNGKPDLAIANGVTNNLSLLLNTGTGSFNPAIQVPVGFGPAGVLAQDLDADGDVDLVAANLYGGTVSILKNRGTGNFEPPVNVAIWGAPRALAAGDFDHDGDLDLAVADEWNNAVALLRNNGTGVFTFIGTASVGLGPSALRAVQLNDDNSNGQIDGGDWPDLVVTNFDANTLSVLMGRADGSLAPAVNYPTGLGPFSVAAGDLNGDGHHDLVVANVLANTVTVLRNLGSGTFAAPVTYAAGAGPSAVTIGDLDGDADLDILVTNGTSQDLSVLRNRGNGTFEPAEDFGVGDFPLSLPFSVAAGDLNADNVLDVAVANGQANNVSVLLNTLVAGAHRARITGTQTASGLDFGVSLNNAPPTLNAIPDPAAVPEDAGPQNVNLTGITAGGGESQTLEVTAMSLNVALVPDPVVQYTSPNTTGTLTWQPLANQSGQAIIQVTVRDAGPDAVLGTQDDGTFARTFAVTVHPVNDPPTLNPIPDPAAIDEDAGLQTVALRGITAGGGETQTLRVTATSDHVSLLPNPTVHYTSPDTTGTLTYTPVADQHGSAVVTVTVRDAGLDGQLDTADDGLATDTFTVVVDPVAEVVDRHIFYNRSAFDGNSPAANVDDDNAIAPDKQALVNGQKATFANYTSYSRGINGIMIDINDLADPASLSAADFEFRTGNNGSPAGWSLLALDPALITIAVRPGAGVAGSDRVTILFPDGAVKKTWLQVTVKATDATGLAVPDVHYWGNAIGDSGNSATDTAVNVVDALGVRANPHTLLKPAAIDDAYDYNRDKQVNVQDELIVRANPTTLLTDLNLIDLTGYAGDGEGEGLDAFDQALEELLEELESVVSKVNGAL